MAILIDESTPIDAAHEKQSTNIVSLDPEVVIDDCADDVARHLVYASYLDGHVLPISTRAIGQWWPRSPSPPLIRELSIGKCSPDPVTPLWAATLLDFYWLERMFGCATATTGSRIFATMHMAGEFSHAEGQLTWAKYEPDPILKTPGTLNKIQEYIMQVKVSDDAESLVSEEDKTTTTDSLASTLKAFDHGAYPSPWPLVPFSNPVPRLEERIPIHALPKTLHIHDPDNVLSVHQRARSDLASEPKERWQLGDAGISHTYSLELSQAGLEKQDNELQEIARIKKQQERELNGYFIHPTDPPGLEVSPLIFISVPPLPTRPEVTPEAHLYLRHSSALGTGNHSYVYTAEYEFPIYVLSGPEMCFKCVLDDIGNQIDDPTSGEIDPANTYKFTWRGSDVPFTYCTLRKPEKSCTADKDDGSGMDPKGLYVQQTRTKEHRYATLFDEDGKDPRVDPNFANLSQSEYLARIREKKCGASFSIIRVDESCSVYTGPLRILKSTTPWYIPGVSPRCKHRPDNEFVLPTATVKIAAKLSIPRDDHLNVEAKNYQKFPDHFFEHWSGYYLIPPSYHPVPCAPIVPQFYGYYVPTPTESTKERGYLSPILLVEDCGKDVSPYRLNLDERRECASLLTRMHRNGWIQGSVYERNVLVRTEEDDGKKSMLPQTEKSFRIIDFGRAMDEGSAAEKLEKLASNEDKAILEMFKLGISEQMNI